MVDEVEGVLQGKDVAELADLTKEIERNMGFDPSFSADMKYWGNLLRLIGSKIS